MAQDAVDKAIIVGHLKEAKCVTEELRLHGHDHPPPKEEKPLHPQLSVTATDILQGVKDEMARNFDDVLARRTRSLFLNVRASVAIAPIATSILAKELKKGPNWETEELSRFETLAKAYLPHSN